MKSKKNHFVQFLNNISLILSFIINNWRNNIKKIIPIVLIGILVLSGLGATAVTNIKNNPPNAPDIDGPTSGKVGVEYNWTFISTDPEGDNITYYVDWADECGGAEWHGPYPSGEEVTIAHKYTYENTFTINTLAVDENGAESNWTYFEVTMPRNKPFNILPLFLRFLEQHPNMFPLLRYLLGL